MTSLPQTRLLLGIGLSLSVSVLTILTFFYYKFTKKESIPKKWKKVGTLDEYYFYPIKSCAPIELDSGHCENLGMRKGDIKDRALMLIDGSGQMVSARTYPQMFKIVPRIVSSSKLVISAPGMENIEFDYSTIDEKTHKKIEALIYGFNVKVLDCGEKYNKWFSNYIMGQPEGLRLVYYPHKIPTRPIDKKYLNGIFTKDDTGTLQDVSSFMLINNTSVQELNTRLKKSVPPLQFRANFYIKTTGPPYDEDHWQWIRIGDETIFRNVGPCYRCIIPNINPFTAERDPDGEPLKTLKTYRTIENAPTKSPGMGVQMGLRAEGVVKSGDTVYVEDLTE